jgi:putative ABC transport system permease protein
VKTVDTLTLNLLTRKDPQKPQPMIVLGLDPTGDILGRYEILRGRTLEKDDTTAVLVGALAAQQNGLDVGSKLETLAGNYDVVGVFNAPVQGADFLAGQAIMNEAYIHDQFELPANIIVAHLSSAADVKSGKNLLSDAEVASAIADIRSTIAADPKLKDRLEAKSFRDYLDSFKQTEIIDKFAWAMSFLAALVGGIGIANTMLMSVFERTREIGLLRAVGWSRTRICVLIVLEGLALSILGGALGVPLGWLEVVAASKVVEMGWIQTAIDPEVALKAVLLATFIGVVGSLYPGLRAANLEPTEALRYE